MITIHRTNSQNADFRILVQKLDQELKIKDGADHAFYAPFNVIDKVSQVVVAYWDSLPVGCGAIKAYDKAGVVEIKRMFVDPAHRGRGIATKILQELESWARELSYSRCILETGLKQPEAIALYKKCGYLIIPNYGQYENVEGSVCFEKTLF
ncbi:MAG: GNAT family N-acetyltransferase [Saprospiraceae bacterium]|nr:GNAT family N-acetyltransferase [Saprospiraceae bacterium]MCB9323944.1 GNAT family N-acetyltransferase [Lewinellaceae bacterium]